MTCIKYTNQWHYGNKKTSSNHSIIYNTVYKAQNTVCSYDKWAVCSQGPCHSAIFDLLPYIWGSCFSKQANRAALLSCLPVQCDKKSETKPQNCLIPLQRASKTLGMSGKFVLLKRNTTVTCHYNLSKYGNTLFQPKSNLVFISRIKTIKNGL